MGIDQQWLDLKLSNGLLPEEAATPGLMNQLLTHTIQGF